MSDLNFGQMQAMQETLQAKYEAEWGALSPKAAREHLLWMMIEAGEAADVIKKKGDGPIMQDSEVRTHFIEELCDVLMYLNDVALCYRITPEEISRVYREKHQRNMRRW